MTASLLSAETLTLENVPRLRDVRQLCDILVNHGVDYTIAGKRDAAEAKAKGIGRVRLTAREKSSTRPRPTNWSPRCAPVSGSSVRCLPACTRRGCRCPAAAPSARGRWISISPALQALGAEIDIEGGYVNARAPNGLIGDRVDLPESLRRRDPHDDDGGNAGARAKPSSKTRHENPKSPTSPTA